MDDEYESDGDFFAEMGYGEEAIEVPDPIETAKATDKEKAPRRVVMNPRPKLDIDRLLNDDNGLPNLLRMMADITFKPGREIKDMRRTLALMEVWSHRLFPRYTFDDFINKCEVLGKKRPVKTHLRKAVTIVDQLVIFREKPYSRRGSSYAAQTTG